jgi:hypothetical protein
MTPPTVSLARMAPALAAALALLAAGCAAGSTVTRTSTTLGEVDMKGLECRRQPRIDSLLGETICASPEAWAEFDARERGKVDDINRQLESVPHQPFGRAS